MHKHGLSFLPYFLYWREYIVSVNSNLLTQISRLTEQAHIFFIRASKTRVCRTTLIDKKASKLSDGYIVQGIAILANECPES